MWPEHDAMTHGKIFVSHSAVGMFEPGGKEKEEMHQGQRSGWVSIRGRKEGNVLFNDTLNTFYLRLYGVGHMVKDHSDSEIGNPLLLFPINHKGSFICTIPQTG